MLNNLKLSYPGRIYKLAINGHVTDFACDCCHSGSHLINWYNVKLIRSAHAHELSHVLLSSGLFNISLVALSSCSHVHRHVIHSSLLLLESPHSMLSCVKTPLNLMAILQPHRQVTFAIR